MFKRVKKPVALIARARAAWNRLNGGVLLRGEFGKCDHNGNHFRVLVDGGNFHRGRVQWVIAKASGGGYSLEDEAMATAVASVLGVECGYGDGDVHYNDYAEDNWKKVAKANGWTLLSWKGDYVIAMWPDEATAKKVLEEYRAWEEKYGL